jgi:hypothetical protein
MTTRTATGTTPTLVRLARFAQTHSHFFGDEAIDELFADRWRSPRPRPRRSGA